MSAHDHHGKHAAGAHGAHGHHHGHDDHHHGEEELHFTARDYHVGFVLSVILTVIPFALVMGKVFETATSAALWVLGIGAVQMVVQMVYFLHMNRKSQGGWIMLALIFTVIILAIAIAGSLWVMFHLNENLMPVSEHMLRIRP